MWFEKTNNAAQGTAAQQPPVQRLHDGMPAAREGETGPADTG
jgi:hypothetical protein